ncbi:tryptophan synthase subunit alpha [Hahella sp. CCB-MM4]|uniref:tryptophan synthase subunit alpha n=1 Tax=Hahella sp. (strain CCB-MM4) TaxID=1926491 RepID=UPI000B9AAD4B|nr:tryptophan synthase subunit alpha [Hahella sp. CCB-MM4]OZG73124.1 tryptophan synthase subunit alpha [Hahella sp. CCB-MM4]
MLKSGTSLQVMSHAVVGFPSLDENLRAIDGLVSAGVRMIELQVPFSDPVADGPTLVNACYLALKQGGSVAATLELARQATARHPQVTFILMSYLNPLYRYGLEQCFRDAAEAGIQGLIIPDWPVESVEPMLPLLDELNLAPVLMVTPNTPESRLQRICQASRMMIYVVARMGVTGHQTRWDEAFDLYLNRIRQYTDLPLAVGFGVRDASDLKALKHKVEVAAVCSRYIEWQAESGSETAAKNMATLITEADLPPFGG